MGDLLQMPPRGFYLANEVGRLAGVSGHMIGQWARAGYICSSQSDAGESPRVYAWQDICEAMMVHKLREEKQTYPRIKQALDSLRHDPELGDWPLATGQIELAGKKTIGQQRRDGHYAMSNRPWQEMFALEDLRRIEVELNHGGWAYRQNPDIKHIEVDPNRLSGRPAIRGRRVPVQTVAELARTERGEEILIGEYDLIGDEITDAVRWWATVTEYEAAA